MENTQDKPLLNKNQLMELKPGECVVKRVMKREDLEKSRIKPTPIFNSEESGKRFLYRYEYLTDTFPNPGEIDLYEINSEDRSHINLKERIWDFKVSLMWIQQNAMEDINEKMTIENLSNSQEVIQAGEKILGNIDKSMSIVEFTDLIFRKVNGTEERDALLSMIKIGSEI